jgi:hypothetical protein
MNFIFIFVSKFISMELIIRNIKSKQDVKLFSELAKRLGLKTTELSPEEKEDIALGIAMEEGKKTGIASEETVMKTLRKIQRRKQ